MTDEEPLNRIGLKISLVTLDLTNDPTVDENLTILTSAYCVANVTIVRRDNMSKVQGRSVSTKEEEVIIAHLENSLVRRTLFHFVAAVSMAAASMDCLRRPVTRSERLEPPGLGENFGTGRPRHRGQRWCNAAPPATWVHTLYCSQVPYRQFNRTKTCT